MKKKQVPRHVSFSEASETWGHIGCLLADESTARTFASRFVFFPQLLKQNALWNCLWPETLNILSVRKGPFKAKLWSSYLWKSLLCEIFLKFLEIRLLQLACNFLKRHSIFLYSFPLFEGKVKFLIYFFFLTSWGTVFSVQCIWSVLAWSGEVFLELFS